MISGFRYSEKKDLWSSGTLRSATLRNITEKRRSQFKPYISPEQNTLTNHVP
jgi:hypothetical protein